MAALLDLKTGLYTLLPPLMMRVFLRDESINTGLQLVGGTLLGALFSLAVLDLFGEVQSLYLLANLVAIAGLAYWIAQGQRGRWPAPFAGVMAILTVGCSAFSAFSAPALGDVTAMDWFFEALLGTVIAWTVFLGLWPAPAPRRLERLWQAIEHDCAGLLRRVAARLANHRPIAYLPSSVNLVYLGTLTRELESNRARLATTSPSYAWLRERLELLGHIYVHIRLMNRTFERLPDAGLAPETRADLVAVLTGLADRLAGRTAALSAELTRIEATSRSLGSGDLSAVRVSVRLASFAGGARDLIDQIEAYRRSAKSEPTAVAPRPENTPPPPSPATAGLRPDSIKAAVKVTLALLLSLSIHILTTVPAGAYLVMIIVIVLCQPNLGRSHLRVRLWFPGVAAGTLYSLAGLALISVVPHFSLLLAWLALGFLIGGYLGAGPDRVGFAGMQFCAGMATVLGMAAFPIGTLVAAEERVLGAILGVLIALAIAHLLWPEHPARQLRDGIAANLRHMSQAIAQLVRDEAADQAAANRTLNQLKHELQANFGLLYDFSYMMSRRVRPAYDYQTMVHCVGMTLISLLSLEKTLAMSRDEEARRRIATPLRQSAPRLAALLNDTADNIATGREAAPTDLQETLADLKQDLHDLAQTPEMRQWQARLGLNLTSEILAEMAELLVALAPSRAAAKGPSAEALAEHYEAAR